MRLVVADSTLLFPAFADPHSISRKLAVVLAWGKLHWDLRAAEAEAAMILQELEQHPGSTFRGAPTPDNQIQAAQNRIAVLEEQLPGLPPDDLGLVVSRPLLTELRNNIVNPRSQIGGLTGKEAEIAQRQALAISCDQVIDEFGEDVPHYTDGRDRKDDPIIHTAILAGADYLVSDDTRHISLSRRKPSVYRHPETGRQVLAVRKGWFIKNVVCTGYHFDENALKEVDGALLSATYGLLTGTAATQDRQGRSN